MYTKIQSENLKGTDSLGDVVFGRGDDVIFHLKVIACKVLEWILLAPDRIQ
jgi:hypothetical protein